MALVFGHGMLLELDRLGRGDWDYHVSQAQAAYTSLLDYGQLPGYDPYHCGGVSFHDNFQSRVFSPTFAFVLLFGPNLGTRLIQLLWLALGFEGMRRLALRLGAAPWGARFAALAVVGNGAILAQLAAGHFGSAPYLLWPLWLLALLEAERRPAHGMLAGGAWLALSYAEGGIDPLLHGAMMALVFCLARAVQARSAAPLRALGLLGLAALGLGAYLIVPSAAHLMGHPRPPIDPEQVPLSALPSLWLSPDLDLGRSFRFAGQRWRFHEYAAYVGPVFLAGLGYAAWRSVRMRERAALGWLLLALFWVVWTLGDFAAWSPWTLAHHLPVLSWLRASGRGMIPAIFCAALAIGLSLREERSARIACVLLGLNLLLVTPRVFDGTFSVPFEAAPDPVFTQRADVDHFALLDRQDESRMTQYVRQNRGALACYEPTTYDPGARLRYPKRAEQWLDPAVGTVRLASFSPNELVLELHSLSAPTTALLNLNYHQGWERADGVPVVSVHGRIATTVRPEDSRVVLRFRAHEVRLLLALSFAVLAALAWLRRREAQRPGS